MPGFFGPFEPLAQLLDDILRLTFLSQIVSEGAKCAVYPGHLLNKLEDIRHCALEGLFVHSVLANRQVTDDCGQQHVSIIQVDRTR